MMWTIADRVVQIFSLLAVAGIFGYGWLMALSKTVVVRCPLCGEEWRVSGEVENHDDLLKLKDKALAAHQCPRGNPALSA